MLSVAGGRFDAITGELSIDGSTSRLRPRTAALLTYLATHAGRLVGKDELMQAVWPDAVVTEDSLVQCVGEIRRALGPARRDLLRTMPRQGYALALPADGVQHDAVSRHPPPPPHPRGVVSFCAAADGSRLAVSCWGAGAPVVRAGNYMALAGIDPADPLIAPQLDAFLPRRAYVTFDARGCGLSERQPAEVSFDAWVSDLAAVVAHLGAPKVTLFGTAQGAAIAVAFAALHADRVERLVLHGGYARNRYCSDDPAMRARAEATIEMARVGWGLAAGEFRQLWVSPLLPTAPLALQRHVAQRQHYSLDGEMAVRHFRVIHAIDVRHLARAVSCPTLITHFDGDVNVPLGLGIELAALIPGSRFVGLSGDAHAPYECGAAWQGVVDAIADFLAKPST